MTLESKRELQDRVNVSLDKTSRDIARAIGGNVSNGIRIALRAFHEKENKMKYSVIVGNIGEVYKGNDALKAASTFDEYETQSIQGYGRAGGESVSLFVDGEPIREHVCNCEEN